ncbi:hypothetical protein [Streptomyces cyanogenus]|uniref:Uncharacterized protein n=1 Tax=Streptomyces cyanogenus TaxID=80860 RepID=A0ABX7TTX0_STRCY|nr:hypothetical protein [Streptomyces cyanogenus]QTD99088.1 hypothetical protein S1361_17185 [Streptomyces cyanogenus]
MIPIAYGGIRPGFRRLGGRGGSGRPETPTPPADERRGSPLLAEAPRRYGHPSPRPVPLGQGFPGPASRTAPSPHRIPVPTPAHPTPRAIRVHRSPR